MNEDLHVRVPSNFQEINEFLKLIYKYTDGKILKLQNFPIAHRQKRDGHMPLMFQVKSKYSCDTLVLRDRLTKTYNGI
jgi:hypothetical protein